MKPTNNNEEIFPCNKCGNHAQPLAKTESRKRVVIHDKDDNEHYYLLLAPDQLKLLEWLEDKYIFDNDRYEWETLSEQEFETI